MKDDQFNDYEIGSMSPGRIAQVAVDANSTESRVPTPAEILSKQTESAAPSSDSTAQVKSSPVNAVGPQISPDKKEAAVSTTNSVSNSSTVNNSFDYSVKSPITESTQIQITNILSEIASSYTESQKATQQAYLTINQLTTSTAEVLNQINRSFNSLSNDGAPRANAVSASGSVVSSPSKSVLGGTKQSTGNKTASTLTPSTSASLTETESSGETTNSLTGTKYSFAELLDGAATGDVTADSIADAVAQIENKTLDRSTNSSSEAAGQEPAKTTPSTSSAVSIKSTSPIKNKSVVNQIVNPPNPVAQGVDNLGKVITNTSESMTSSITEKLSTISNQSSSQTSPTQIFNNTTSSNTMNQLASQAEPAMKAEAAKAEEESSGPDLNSYYLQAIYDALIVQGIKIRTI